MQYSFPYIFSNQMADNILEDQAKQVQMSYQYVVVYTYVYTYDL